MSHRDGPKRTRESKAPSAPGVSVERLEERELLFVLNPKKTPAPPPYPPGTRYGLLRRENLPPQETASGGRPTEKEREPSVERLEERIALSLLVPKKQPSPPPYSPGTLYGLAKRENIPACDGGEDRAAAERSETRRVPEVETLEERIALSLLIPKKKPLQPPYPPGADYSLARRENLRW